MNSRAVPSEIKQAGPSELEITWSDGHVSLYPVVYLRRACRCASCVDEWSGEQILRPEQVPADVKPLGIDPVGRYAIHIDWSDGHASGIYSFDHLREICPCQECAPDREIPNPKSQIPRKSQIPNPNSSGPESPTEG